jgi:parvulin-like peptidyl-prolyl isomerase
MLASRASAALVEDVEVTVQQVQEYFEEHREDLIIGAEVRLRIIAVREKGEADKILAELQQGKNFTRLAAKHSRGKLASRGGDTGWVDFRKLPPLLQEAVGRLKIGDVAGPLEKSTDEYLLLGLQDRRPLRAKSLEEAQPEIERRLLAEERQKVIAAWLEEQETKAKIEVFLEPEKF